MVINGDALELWKTYKYPNGMSIANLDEFEDRLLKKARSVGISCAISHDSLSLGSVAALIGLGLGDCLRISKEPEKERKRGLLSKVANQAFKSFAGDYVITLSREGTYVFMQIYRCTSQGALLDVIEKPSAGSSVRRDSWSVIMEDVLEAVAESCK